jgi:hypothetical protein
VLCTYLGSSAWRGRASGRGTHGSPSTSLCAVADLQVQQQSRLAEQLDLLAVAVRSTGVARESELARMDVFCVARSRRGQGFIGAVAPPSIGRGTPTTQTIGGRGEGRGEAAGGADVVLEPMHFSGERETYPFQGRETKETGVACDTMRVGLYCSLYCFIWASVC